MTFTPAFCSHGRLGDQCEDCALLRSLERGDQVVEGEPVTVPTVELAEEDLFVVVRKDEYVQVMKGDAIPTRLLNMPRVPRVAAPVEEQPKAARKTTRKRVETDPPELHT